MKRKFHATRQAESTEARWGEEAPQCTGRRHRVRVPALPPPRPGAAAPTRRDTAAAVATPPAREGSGEGCLRRPQRARPGGAGGH